jgi:D-alanyl-D-alanine carboxypeptidase
VTAAVSAPATTPVTETGPDADATDPATTTSTSTTTTTSTTTPPTTSTTSVPTTTSTTTTTLAVTLDPTTGRIVLPSVDGAFATLATGNAAASITIIRDHAVVYARAAGSTLGGTRLTPDTPLVLASVSKLITALTIARLAERGDLHVSAPVPWDQLFVAHDPAWDDVTVRELLDHTGGMPKAQRSWLNDPGSCAIPLGAALATPPRATRGQWTYSNGNYCALGLLIEAVTGKGREVAADELVFDPIGVTGPHLTTDRPAPGDGPYAQGVARLERLGGAGTWMASTNDLAKMLDAVTPADLETMQFPGIILDQYGWGHTGTVDGAKSCAWVMEHGRTVVVATVSGNKPLTGGKVCDLVVPSIAADLGFWADRPVRRPD